MANPLFTPLKFVELPGKDGRGMGYIRPENEDGMEIAHMGDMGRSTSENLAYAHLFTAAPDMKVALKDAAYALNACRLLISDKENRDYAGELVQNARAALAKAEGKVRP